MKITECQICFGLYSLNNNIEDLCKICNKSYCKYCIKKYIICKIKNNNAVIKCLCLIDSKIISKYLISTYISTNMFKTYINVLNRLKNINNCPVCNVEFYNENKDKKIYCNNCNNDICMICEKKDHIGKCKPISLNIWGAHQCPKCNLTVIKDGGCDHMTCSWCNYQYSYETKESWKKIIKQRQQEQREREQREIRIREEKELRERQIKEFHERQKIVKQQIKEQRHLRRKEKINLFKERVRNIFKL